MSRMQPPDVVGVGRSLGNWVSADRDDVHREPFEHVSGLVLDSETNRISQLHEVVICGTWNTDVPAIDSKPMALFHPESLQQAFNRKAGQHPFCWPDFAFVRDRITNFELKRIEGLALPPENTAGREQSFSREAPCLWHITHSGEMSGPLFF